MHESNSKIMSEIETTLNDISIKSFNHENTVFIPGLKTDKLFKAIEDNFEIEDEKKYLLVEEFKI